MSTTECHRCDGSAIDPSGLGTCGLCLGTGKDEPTQFQRVEQLQRERNTYREVLQTLVDALERGDHLTLRHTLITPALKLLRGAK